MQSSTVNSALSAVSQSVSGTYVQDVSIKMLDNAIDLNNTMAQGTIKMMENSVTPYLGSNIDISVSHINIPTITAHTCHCYYCCPVHKSRSRHETLHDGSCFIYTA